MAEIKSVFEAGICPSCYSKGLIKGALEERKQWGPSSATQRRTPYQVNILCGTQSHFLTMKKLPKKERNSSMRK